MHVLPRFQNITHGLRVFLVACAVLYAVIFAGCKSSDPQGTKEDDGGRTVDESYGFSLSASGEHVFTAVEEDSGYTAEEFTVSVTNTGSVDTGLIQLALSGSDADTFTLTPSSIENIAVSKAQTFLLTTTEGLPAGDYEATVTATGPDNFSRSFIIKFNVYIPTIIPVTFEEVRSNGASQTTTTTEISFRLDPPVDGLTIDNVSLNDGGTGAQIETITAGTEAGWWVLAISGITQEGTAAVNLTKQQYSFSGSSTAAVHYRFTYGLNVVTGGSLNFGTKIVGYAEAPAAQTVTVVNAGNQPLNGVAVAVNAGSNYTAAPAAADIAAGASASFTIRPKTGLVVGTYSLPALTVGTASTTASFSTSFTVRNGTITAGTVANATMTVNLTSAAADADVTVTVTPNDNYALKPTSLALSPTAATFTRVNATQYKFKMPANTDVTVTAQVIKPAENHMLEMSGTDNTVTVVKKAAGDYEEVYILVTSGTLKANRGGTAKVTLVAGGGGGGGTSNTTDDYGGGGGAGGVLRNQSAVIADGATYGVTIGGGGAGGVGGGTASEQGKDGGDTVLKKADGSAWFTALGGGGGGSGRNDPGMHGRPGGSGGGGGLGPGTAVGTGGAGTQGKNGGTPASGNTGHGAAGGGGFNAVGGANDGTTGGAGGAGIELSELTNAGWTSNTTVSTGGRGGYNSAPAAGTQYGGGGGGGGNAGGASPLNGAAGKGGILIVTIPWISP